ncbi:MAG TPA: glycosyltransferase [Membranihabitans sp.]|nr:glycosyltransferase [Membranihabitans sp.]
MTDSRVSIIIPHRDQPQQLQLCLTQLVELGYHLEEIILVDNGSQSLPEFLKEFPIRVLRCDSPPSPYMARNLGIKEASTDIIVLLDVNAIVQPGWLENALVHLREDIILSGVAIRPNPRRNDVFQRFDYLHSVLDPYRTGSIRALPATNLFFYKKTWETVGPFREVRSLGDMEWTSRAFVRGYKLIADPTVRFEYPFKTRAAFRRKYQRLGGGHAENKFHAHPVLYVLKNFLPPSPTFVQHMHQINQNEGMELSRVQLFFLCYLVKINYALGFLKKKIG